MQSTLERPEAPLGHRFDVDAYPPHGGDWHLVARAFGDGQVQGSLRLDRLNEPPTDLILLRPRADFYRDSHPSAADEFLLVEVADSARGYDRDPRLALYTQRARLTAGKATPAPVSRLRIDVEVLLA